MLEKVDNKKIKLVTNSVPIIKDYYQIALNEPKFLTTPLDDDQIIELTKELFREIPNKYINDRFDFYTNPSNSLLHMRYHRKLSTNYLGLSFVDFENHLSYGLISRQNSIQDIITLGHEIFHMIIRENEEPFFYESNKTTYMEVDGFFANFLFSQKLKEKGYDSQELNDFDTRDLQLTLRQSILIFTITSGFNLMKQQGKIDFSKLSSILEKQNIPSPITKNDFTSLLKYNFNEFTNYFISYLTALDLFSLYKVDPELAINNLLLVPTLEGNKPKKDLESIGITFFEDGYHNLEEQCKKLLKTKTTSQ